MHRLEDRKHGTIEEEGLRALVPGGWDEHLVPSHVTSATIPSNRVSTRVLADPDSRADPSATIVRKGTWKMMYRALSQTLFAVLLFNAAPVGADCSDIIGRCWDAYHLDIAKCGGFDQQADWCREQAKERRDYCIERANQSGC